MIPSRPFLSVASMHMCARAQVVEFMKQNEQKGSDEDVWDIFGRSMLKDFGSRRRAKFANER